MTATIKYFVGGELEAFVSGSHASITWTTTSGRYDSEFSRGAVTLSTASNDDYIRIPLSSAQPTFWARINHHFASMVGLPTLVWMTLVNASGTGVARLIETGGTTPQPLLQFQYYNGTAWVSAGSPRVVPTDALHLIDFRVDLANSGGVLQAYVDGELLGELTGDTAWVSPASVAEIRVHSAGVPGASRACCISEVQILDVSTLGRRLGTLWLTGTGATDAWTPSTGATSVATVDEAGTYADADYASSATANQVYTGITSDLSTTAQQYAIDGVVIAYRALHGAIGPQNLKGVVRVGGTDYPASSNVANLNTGFGYTWAEFDTNPATGVAWTPAEINTAGFETGAKSIT